MYSGVVDSKGEGKAQAWHTHITGLNYELTANAAAFADRKPVQFGAHSFWRVIGPACFSVEFTLKKEKTKCNGRACMARFYTDKTEQQCIYTLLSVFSLLLCHSCSYSRYLGAFSLSKQRLPRLMSLISNLWADWAAIIDEKTNSSRRLTHNVITPMLT